MTDEDGFWFYTGCAGGTWCSYLTKCGDGTAEGPGTAMDWYVCRRDMNLLLHVTWCSPTSNCATENLFLSYGAEQPLLRKIYCLESFTPKTFYREKPPPRVGA